MSHEHRHEREHELDAELARGREIIRQVAEAGREAVRTARDAARSRVRGDAEQSTRARIQRVAIELFTAHGYEATSLREIAERLGVTKAALYYHFKTKDEIIQSLIDDQVRLVGELVTWLRGQPRTAQTRREFVRRYADMLHQRDHYRLMRFFERNQSSMQQHKAGSSLREQMAQMVDTLTPPNAPLTDQIRCALAIFALHATAFTLRDPDLTDDQRREAALEVALDLVG